MKLKVITTTSDRAKCYQLERSLKHFGYDYHIIEHEWHGFLDKLHHAYHYLKAIQAEGYTHFLYTDAWDTFALHGPHCIPVGFYPLDFLGMNALILSAERNCYPYVELADQYPECNSPFKYVNGGGWAGSISAFIRMYEDCPPTDEMNDQVYLTNQYLSRHKEGLIILDSDCGIFQTIGFCEPERDFDLNKESNTFTMNRITRKFPVFWHGNGHTPMDHIYALIPEQ